MFGRIRIGPRLLLLISVQIAISLVIGAMTLTVLNFASTTTEDLNSRVTAQAKLTSLSDGLHEDLLGSVYDVSFGTTTWAEARENVTRARDDFESGWSDFLAGLDADEAEFVGDVFGPNLKTLRQAFKDLAPILEAQDRPLLSLFVTNDLNPLVEPFLNALVASTSLQSLEAGEALAASRGALHQFLLSSLGAIVVGLLLALALGFFVMRSISQPIHRIADTVERMTRGDFEARTDLKGSDEMCRLGQAFDAMLNERVATLSHAERENARLNESVIRLLEAVAKLSERDLTVKVPVTEDVTGPVADSLNLLTEETAKVLHGVQRISGEVSQTSMQVKSQSVAVIDVATNERIEVEDTVKRLAEAAETMTRIAKLAHTSNTAAQKAILSTRTAVQTVTNTVAGIDGIRDTIRETEKRIKRLGERSQEISGVVNLINTIAERTHILALNASMHAASAGEAGRGFAVVADEVQRLAENAREATSQISTLVNNIQVETAGTVTTMNDVISQVVSESQLAEQAGKQMRDTERSTAELVSMVRKIAERSRDQAQTSIKLSRRANVIRSSTQETRKHLTEQSAYTDMLVQHAKSLVEAVSVFNLPKPARQPQTDPKRDRDLGQLPKQVAASG